MTVDFYGDPCVLITSPIAPPFNPPPASTEGPVWWASFTCDGLGEVIHRVRLNELDPYSYRITSRDAASVTEAIQYARDLVLSDDTAKPRVFKRRPDPSSRLLPEQRPA